ncbi:MAG: aminodeoxychorismate/anthranilate synthase component II [Bacteroidetes bacterium]|nr:aminodeoxychorismate/anthranilate synthase component II [Bacteroidota bacterium]MCY4204876.1 aminodeoxychorismate/anthranilate synthase component II [Bacteroidota bacterium]
MILILNNRDSFVFNISRYFQELGETADVVESDNLTLRDVEIMQPKALVISPGPCTPDEAGISLNVVSYFSGKLPILGVCLGHQAIAQSFGCTVTNSLFPKYGETSLIMHNGRDLFRGLPNPLKVGLYHSLIVTQIDESDLIVQAESPEGEIMGIRHSQAPTFGVQFHPESILSDFGYEFLQNFISATECFHAGQ